MYIYIYIYTSLKKVIQKMLQSLYFESGHSASARFVEGRQISEACFLTDVGPLFWTWKCVGANQWKQIYGNQSVGANQWEQI